MSSGVIGPDLILTLCLNRKNWGVMHYNLEQSVCCVLILIAGTFKLWHCHYQTTPTKSLLSSQNIQNEKLKWDKLQLLSTSSQLLVLILGSFSSIVNSTTCELRRKLYFSWTRLVQKRNELDWAFMQDILINHNGTSCLMVYLASVTSGMSWYGDLINTSAPPPWSRIQEVLSV